MKSSFLILLFPLAPMLVSCVDVNVTSLDCEMRVLALEYAHKIQPWRGAGDQMFKDIHDALRLKDLCNIPMRVRTAGMTHDESKIKSRNKQLRTARQLMKSSFYPRVCTPSSTRHCIFVSSNDFSRIVESDGSLYRPAATARQALELSRSIGEPSRTTIVFRGGIHELSSTLSLGPEDSGLTLQGFPGEEAWISGGISIPKSIEWEPWTKNVLVANLTGILQAVEKVPNVASLFTTSPHRRFVRARFPNADPEISQWGYASSQKLLHSVPSSLVKEWHPPPRGKPPEFHVVEFSTHPPQGVPVKNDSIIPGYNSYASGSGGVCADLWGDEADSYWCSNASAGGWGFVDRECAIRGQLQIPVGMTYDTVHEIGRRLKAWGQMAVGGILHAWHSQSWSMHMFEIESHTENGSFQFHKGGGRQGGRNWCRCDQCPFAGAWCGQLQNPPNKKDRRLVSGSWLVENVLAELDQPGEFFFDPATKLLYVIPNVTAAQNDETSVPDLLFGLHENLLELRNVSNITISNLGFRDSAPTYMSDWSAPSGGDWAMHRGGAIFMEQVRRIKVRDCTFRRLDGTAVFLSRRTRNVTIERNVFEWLGENAIATWGETHGYDASHENYPMGTIVQHNVMRELGIYQKQSSAWGQAKAALTTIRNNIMFNMPRAAINFNDGMGGGDVIKHNLIFSTCRESGDHGPINSWDRQPFLTTLRDGKTKSFIPPRREIFENFVIANYGGSQGVDNDDGSSWYHIHDNVFYAAEGLKMNYGGHDSVFENNVILSYPYDGQQCVSVGNFAHGHGHVARGNKCVVGLGKRFVDSGCGDPSCATGPVMPIDRLEHVVNMDNCRIGNVRLSNNSYYTTTGAAAFKCHDDRPINRKGRSLEDVQKSFDLETGSTVGQIPLEETIVTWVKQMLF